MAMNKTEKALLERLQSELDAERAKNAPDYSVPVPMAKPESGWINGYACILETEIVVQAWQESHLFGYHKHRTGGRWEEGSPDYNISATQRGFPIYATRLEALLALRLAMTEKFAKKLAAIDKQIEAVKTAS